MKRTMALVATAAILVSTIAWSAMARGTARAPAAACTMLDPTGFVDTIDNPYYPLPVGRTLCIAGSGTDRLRWIGSPSPT